MNEARKGLALILFSQVVWGFSALALKLFNPDFPGPLLIFTRFLIGSFTLLMIIIVNRRYVSNLLNLQEKTIRSAIIIGVIGSGLADIFFLGAIRASGAIVGATLARLEIPLGVLFATLILKEPLTKRILLATVFSFAGAILLSIRESVSLSSDIVFYQGLMYGVIAAILWAVAGIWAKKILNDTDVSPIILTFIRLTVGGVFNGVVALMFLSSFGPLYGTLTSVDWTLMAYLGIVASALAFWTYYGGLSRMNAGAAAILLSVSALVTMVGGVLIGERLGVWQWIGVASILVSIVIVSKRTQPTLVPLED